jgi:hypothetical protein
VTLSGPQDVDLEDDTPIPEPEWLKDAKQPVLDCISVNAALAPIRQELVGLLEAAADDDHIELHNEGCLREFVYVAGTRQ